MKKTVLLIICLVVAIQGNTATLLFDRELPEQTSSISVYASTLLLASIVNLSYEKLYLTSSNSYVGFTTGFTTQFLIDDQTTFGGHFTLTLLKCSQKWNWCFEGRLGAAYLPFVIASPYSGDPDFKFIPVVSLGARYQKPERNTFIRFGLSTAGIGFGVGWFL